MATVYRFADTAAVHTTGGPTRYIDAKGARALARALYRVARSIESESFVDSKCGTVTVPDYAHAPDARKGKRGAA